MEYLLERRGSALLVLRREYDHGPLPPFLSRELWGWSWLSSRKEGVCPSSPKNDRSMTMAIRLFSSVESCGGGLCHHLLEKRRSALLVLRRKGI